MTDHPMLPLTGIKVIDFTQAMLGPSATLVLADFGADVIKIERPGSGDLMRWALEDDPAGGDNPVYSSMNRNKRSVTIDLRSTAGQQIVYDLARDADVIVSNFRPGIMERLGFDYEHMRQLNPRLIYAFGSGFGPSGPNVHKGGQDVLAQAMTGVMARKSDPSHPLAVYATCLADYSGGMHLAQGVLLALLARERTGQGQRVDVSLYDSMLAMQMQEVAVQLMRDDDLNWGAMPLTCVFETSDEPLVLVGAFKRNPLRDICAALGIDDLSLRPEYASMAQMKAHITQLRSVLQEEFLKKPRQHWLQQLEDQDLLCAPVRTLEEALADPQTEHNAMVWEIPRPDGETVKVIASPVHLSDTPARPHLPPPRMGQHSDDVLAAIGYDAQRIADLREEGVLG